MRERERERCIRYKAIKDAHKRKSKSKCESERERARESERERERERESCIRKQDRVGWIFKEIPPPPLAPPLPIIAVKETAVCAKRDLFLLHLLWIF